MTFHLPATFFFFSFLSGHCQGFSFLFSQKFHSSIIFRKSDYFLYLLLSLLFLFFIFSVTVRIQSQRYQKKESRFRNFRGRYSSVVKKEEKSKFFLETFSLLRS